MGKSEESKTHTDPLAFLLAVLVSSELQLPRTPEPRGAPSATTSTKDYARHPDPKGSPKEWLSAAGSQLTLPATKDPYHMPTMGRHETNQMASVSGLGNQVHSSVRKQDSLLIKSIVEFVADRLPHPKDKHLEKARKHLLWVPRT